MISVILLNWNGKRFLEDCLRAICAQTYQQYELIIIDNHSTDGSQELLRHHDQHARLFLNDRNLGYCGGANLGIRESRGEYVLLMNADVLLEPTFLAQLMTGIGYDSTIGIATGKLLRFDKTTLDSTGQFLRKNLSPLERGYDEPDTGQYDCPEYVFSSCGAVALYRRTMLDDIGLDGEYFDESYSSYYEDLDIGWRAQLFGWKAYYVPAAVAYHYRGGGLVDFRHNTAWFERIPGMPGVSMTKKPVSLQRQIIKNRYLTLVKNASIQDIVRGFPAILKYEILLWGYVLCARPALFGALVDLIKLLPTALKKRRYIQASPKHQEFMLKKQDKSQGKH